VHYFDIIGADKYFHGEYIGYPIVFIASILLAFIVSYLSKPYSGLIKR
jgi:hypothetical protein